MKSFNITGTDGSRRARTGKFTTQHGTFQTPNFMPVGTRGSVKGVDVERLAEAGAEIMLVNTYHLWLRPGPERVRDLGGIHDFTGWKGPVLSDSGGFQIFSLKSIRKISEEGVEFQSHLDGRRLFLSPAKAVEIQELLGVDIAMVLDECPEGNLPRDEVERSLEMTLRWAGRSFEARTDSSMRLFGITQGGVYPDLRERSADGIRSIPFDGEAIGGLSVGEEKNLMYEVLSYHVEQLSPEKIHYLMGVGTPEDIVQAVSEGVDLFDCVMPTRSGRFGRAFIRGESPFINIKNAKFAGDTSPLDASCGCPACRSYSRAYISHLFRVGEMLGPQLVSLHNLTHYFDLMKSIRHSIEAGTFGELHRAERARWEKRSEEDN